MGVTELFMKALANKWVKLVDKVGYLLAFIQFSNKKQTFWPCISKNRFCNLHHFRLHRNYCYSCFLSGYSFSSQIYVVLKAKKCEKVSQLYTCFTNYLICTETISPHCERGRPLILMRGSIPLTLNDRQRCMSYVGSRVSNTPALIDNEDFNFLIKNQKLSAPIPI